VTDHAARSLRDTDKPQTFAPYPPSPSKRPLLTATDPHDPDFFPHNQSAATSQAIAASSV